MSFHPIVRLLLLVAIVAAPCLAQGPEYQVNTPAASLTFDGVIGTATSPAITQSAQGAVVQADLATNIPVPPFDAAISTVPLVSASGGGLTTNANQVVNIDTTDPSLVFLSTGTFVPSFSLNMISPTFSLFFTVPTNVTLINVSAQMAVLSIAHPDGLVLSQACQLEGRVDWGGHPYSASNLACPPYVTPVTLGNDDVAQLNLQAPLNFYGTSQTQVFVHSNGFVTFGAAGPPAGILDATQFNTIVPLIAACATDLDPSAGGTVSMGTSGPTFDICFTGVPVAVAGGTNTFRIQVNPGGIFIFFDANMTVTDTFVAISAGANLYPTMSVNWSWMGGPNGPSSFMPGGMPFCPYQQFTQTDAFDLGGRQLICLFDGAGFPNTLP